MAGMGKSEYIKTDAKAKGCRIVELLLAGEVNHATLESRLSNLLMELDDVRDFCICIKIDYIDEFETHSWLVDYVLFCFCILKKINTEKGCVTFESNLKKIYIELGNTFYREVLIESKII